MDKRSLITSALFGAICVGIGFGLSEYLHETTTTTILTDESIPDQLRVVPENSTVTQPPFEDVTETTTSEVTVPEVVDSTDPVGSDSRIKSMRRMLADGGQRQFSDFFNQLNYTDEQITAFMDLFIENGLEWIDRQEDLRINTEMLTDEEKLDIHQRRVVLQDEMEERFDQAILGQFPMDYYHYKDYRETKKERIEVKSLTQSFVDPLDNHTREQLIRILFEEGTNAGVSRQSRYFVDSADHFRDQRETITAKDERDRVFLDQAGSYLSNDQYEALKQALDVKKKQRELSLQLQKLNAESRELRGR